MEPIELTLREESLFGQALAYRCALMEIIKMHPHPHFLQGAIARAREQLLVVVPQEPISPGTQAPNERILVAGEAALGEIAANLPSRVP
jgi:hypothetical protein